MVYVYQSCTRIYKIFLTGSTLRAKQYPPISLFLLAKNETVGNAPVKSVPSFTIISLEFIFTDFEHARARFFMSIFLQERWQQRYTNTSSVTRLGGFLCFGQQIFFQDLPNNLVTLRQHDFLSKSLNFWKIKKPILISTADHTVFLQDRRLVGKNNKNNIKIYELFNKLHFIQIFPEAQKEEVVNCIVTYDRWLSG